MIVYNLSDKINNLVDESIEKYGCDVLPTDEEVWEIAKLQDKLPVFENIYTYLFFLNLINHLPKKIHIWLLYKWVWLPFVLFW